MEIRNVLWKNNEGTFYFGDGESTSTEYQQATQAEVIAYEAIEIPKQLTYNKWNSVKTQWDALTVTVGTHTFAANEEAMKLMAFKANNMGSNAVILWVEDWATFNTNIVELKEALNLAADAHQVIFNSVFGV